MGQYYVIANLDKREYLDPYCFGSGVKLMEFSMDGASVMTGLAVLLASSNGQGGGDLYLPHDTKFDHIPGRWKGDRVVVAGDYDSDPDSPGFAVYMRCRNSSALEELANAAESTGMFTDISHDVLGCLLEDGGFKEQFLDIPQESETWKEYNKNRRRNMWAAARPDDELPPELK